MPLSLRKKARAAARADRDAAEQATAYIDAGAELVGQLRFQETVRIDGRVEGEIRAAKSVIVGESGSVDASVHARSVVVYGTIEGDVRAERKITLHKSARVTGEIQTAGIVVEEGARVRGCILIGDDDGPRESPTATLALPAEPAEPESTS